MMLLKWLTLNLRQVLRAYGEDPHALLAMSIFGRAGRGEAAPDQRGQTVHRDRCVCETEMHPQTLLLNGPVRPVIHNDHCAFRCF